MRQSRMAVSESWLWLFRAGMGFILLASLLFLMGFATDHWHDNDIVNYGLWETCDGPTCTAHSADDLSAYHIATQALQVLAVTCYFVAPLLHFLFYCSRKDKTTGWRTRVFDVVYSMGVIFHFISVLVFGLEIPTPNNLSWSYHLSASATCIAAAGIIMVMVSRHKAMHNFGFFTGSKNRRRSGRVGISGNESTTSSSRVGTPQELTTRRSSKVFGPQIRHKHYPANVNVHVHASHSSQYPAFSPSSPAVPYPHPYGQTSPAPYSDYPLVTPTALNQQPFNPAYPPSGYHSNPSAQPLPAGLAPLRAPPPQPSTMASAPPPESPPTYGDAVSHDTPHNYGNPYDPAKSNNWVGS